MDLTLIVTAPGELLLALWTPSEFTGESEARADLAISLGLMFWMAVLTIGLLSRRRWDSMVSALACAAIGLGQTGWETALRQWRAFARPGTWRRAWSIVWRAEMAHLAVYALIPSGIAAGRAVLFGLFLPFSVMSFADQPGASSAFDHLRRPVCWTFVSLCASPSAQFRGLTALELSACQRAERCPTLPIAYSDRWQWAWKLLWAALATLWIARWWRSHESASAKLGTPPLRDGTRPT